MKEGRFQFSKAFPSDYVRNLDLGGEDKTVKIAGWRYADHTDIGKNGEQMQGVVLDLAGTKKVLVLNVTNFATIKGIHGDDPDDWTGKKIILYPTTTRFGPDPKHPCIRVRNVNPATGKEPDLL